MLYEYHTDTTRMLTELGRMFVAIHRKETGKDLFEVNEFNRVIKECQRRIDGKEPEKKVVLNGSNVDTIEISFMMMRNTRNLFKITKKRKKTLKKDCMNL